jgi:hypothetical protein
MQIETWDIGRFVLYAGNPRKFEDGKGYGVNVPFRSRIANRRIVGAER